MSQLAISRVPLARLPSVRDLVAAYPHHYRWRFSLAIDCAAAGTYAASVAALALMRSLVAEKAPCVCDAQVFGAEIAIRLGFGGPARDLAQAIVTESRFHRAAMAQLQPMAARLPEHRPVFEAVERVVQELSVVTEGWSGTMAAGGPTAALLVARDPRPWLYGLDLGEAIPLALATKSTAFVCAEPHVGYAEIRRALEPLFSAGTERIVAVVDHPTSTLDREGYRSSASSIRVAGGPVSLGDLRAWKLPTGELPQALPEDDRTLCAVVWTRV